MAALEDDDTDPPGQASNRPFSVALDEKALLSAGLQTTVLEARSLGTELAVPGKAINLQPLLALRHRYLALLAENQQALARLKQAEQSKQRQQDLYQHGVTSKKRVQEQQLQWQTEKTALQANTLQAKAIIDEARLAWGGKLASWALSPDANKLAGFLSGQAVLLQITAPVDKPLPVANANIFVDTSGRRDKARLATFISEAPQTDSTLPGQGYFFQADGRFIKPGMPVLAWIPEQEQALSGVMIPRSAVVWLLDQLFVYVKVGQGQFVRRIVNDYRTSPEGYWVGVGFSAGEVLVTAGAQMLLSEEQRRQIPDEDD